MKTAVRQILEDLQEHFPKQMKEMYENNQLLLEDIFLKAKETEKQQIIDANLNGFNEGCRYLSNEKLEFESAEHYYQETFKNK